MRRLLVFFGACLICTASFGAGYLAVHLKILTQSPASLLYRFSRSASITRSTPEMRPQRLPLTDRRVSSPRQQGSTLLYFEKNSGKLFSLNPATSREHAVTDHILPYFKKALWSPSGTDYIVELEENSHPRFHAYLDGASQPTTLPSYIRSVAFDPSGKTLAQFAIQGEAGSVVISQRNGDLPKKILDTRLQDVHILWPLPNALILVSRSPKDTYAVFLLDLEGRISLLFESEQNPYVHPAPDGYTFLYTGLSPHGAPILNIFDLSTKRSTPLGVPTLSNKCAWIGSAELLCGVPTSLEHGYDSLEQISLSGVRSALPEQFENIVISTIIHNPYMGTAFIVNALDDRIYQIEIHPSR